MQHWLDQHVECMLNGSLVSLDNITTATGVSMDMSHSRSYIDQYLHGISSQCVHKCHGWHWTHLAIATTRSSTLKAKSQVIRIISSIGHGHIAKCMGYHSVCLGGSCQHADAYRSILTAYTRHIQMLCNTWWEVDWADLDAKGGTLAGLSNCCYDRLVQICTKGLTKAHSGGRLAFSKCGWCDAAYNNCKRHLLSTFLICQWLHVAVSLTGCD